MRQLPSFKGTVYRGTNLPQEVLKDFKVGNIVTEKGFTSASVNETKKFSGEVDLVIDSVNGKKISFISNFPNEDEVLFAPNTKFRVLSAEFDETTGKRTIILREVANNE